MQADERPKDGDGLSSVPEEMLTESEKRHEGAIMALGWGAAGSEPVR